MARIAAARDHVVAQGEELGRAHAVARHGAHPFAASLDRAFHPGQHRLDFRVVALGGEAHRRRDVRGADEQQIDSLDAGDLLDVVDPLQGFDLAQDQEVVLETLDIIGLAHPVIGGADQRGGAAPDAARGKAAGGDGGGGLPGALDHRHHDALGPGVQRAANIQGVVARHPDQRRRRRRRHGLHLGDRVLDVAGPVLEVDQGEIVARQGDDLGRRRAAHRQPQAERFLARPKAVLEPVLAKHPIPRGVPPAVAPASRLWARRAARGKPVPIQLKAFLTEP